MFQSKSPFDSSTMFPVQDNDTANSKLQLSKIAPHDVFLGLFLLFVSCVFYVSELTDPAKITLAILAIILSIRYPAWAVALCITTLAFDYVVTPEQEGSESFLSPFRLLQLLVLGIHYPFLLIRIFVIRRYDQLVSKNIILWFLLFAFFAFCTLFWSPEIVKGCTTLAKFLIQLTFFHLSLHTFRSKNDLIRLILFTVIFSAIISFYVVFIGGENVLHTDNVNRRMDLTGTGINTYAGISGLALICYIVYCAMSKNTALKILLFFSVPLITFSILKCGTRSVFVGIPLAFVFISTIVYWKKFYVLAFRLLMGGLVCVILFIWSIHSDIIGEKIMDRLFSVNIKSFDISRVAIWKTGVINYLYSPRGTGLGGEYLFVEAALVGEAHNTFISVLIQTSLIGLILFTIPMIMIWKNAWNIPDQQMRFCALLIYFSILVQANRATLITNRFLWFYLIITCLYIEISAKLTSKERPNEMPYRRSHVERSV